MPARVQEFLPVHVFDMPVDTILLGASPPSLGPCFRTASAVGFLPQRISSPCGGYRMGLGTKGDLLLHLQRERLRLPLRSCIKVRGPAVNGFAESSERDTMPDDDAIRNVDSDAPTCRSGDAENGERTAQSQGSCRKVERSSLLDDVVCVEKGKKRVSFADAKGLSLHTVKYMDGPSNTPPSLRMHSLRDVIQDAEAKPTHPFMYVPDFEQPASNYLEFRDRLQKGSVCLENVMIKENITVVGTVKVKNISFEKSVFVRVSFNDWKSHTDVQASYVFPTQPSCSDSRDKFDTFSFNLNMPPNLGGKGFEFCVCYTANGQTFWDNNKGNNYRIVTDKEKEYVQTKGEVSYQNLSGDYSYGQFSFWQVGSHDERPYW